MVVVRWGGVPCGRYRWGGVACGRYRWGCVPVEGLLTIEKEAAPCSRRPIRPASVKYLPEQMPSSSGETTSSDTADSSRTLEEMSWRTHTHTHTHDTRRHTDQIQTHTLWLTQHWEMHSWLSSRVFASQTVCVFSPGCNPKQLFDEMLQHIHLLACLEKAQGKTPSLFLLHLTHQPHSFPQIQFHFKY